MDKNYVEVDGDVLVNLRDDTLSSASQLASGVTGHLRTGEKVTGTGGNMSANPLYGKILAVTGDSICAGEKYAGGYAGIIASENSMTVQNIAESGGTIVNTSGHFNIGGSISSMRSDADYVLLEGGINDSTLSVTLGSITNGFYATPDTTTFAGAFEKMLSDTLNRFPTAKIGYIFVHKTSVGDFMSTSGANSYYGIAKAACEKWGVPYCDLNTLCPPIPFVDSLLSYSDGVHPTEDGYRVFYVPKITAWMKTL